MNMSTCRLSPANTDDPREFGPQVAMRIVAVLRTGRSYAIGNQAFTTQLEQLQQVLRPAFQALGSLELLEYQGDLHMNGVRLPLRGAHLRFFEQLQSEFHVRQIAGLCMAPELELAELEAFMRFFLSSDIYKGEQLLHACHAHGIANILPALAIETDEDVPASRNETSLPLNHAMQAYDHALRSANFLLEPEGLVRGAELRHLRRVAQPLVDEALAGDWQAVPMGTLRHEHQRGSAHAVHTCLVAISIGRHLGLERRALADLGVAALLHDLGKDAPGEKLRQPMDSWDPETWDVVERHPLEGLRRIARSCPLTAASMAAMRVALEHHAVPGMGYPAFDPAWRLSEYSSIVAIADLFVSLLAHRSPRAARLTPHEALGLILGPMRSSFDDALRAALVRAVGLYPPGQVVELDDHSLARALAVDPDQPERPIVAMLRDVTGAPVTQTEPLGFLPPERHVLRALAFDEWPEEARDAA